MTDEQAERIETNIDLAFRWLKAVVDDPRLLDEIPDGTRSVRIIVDEDAPGGVRAIAEVA